MIAIFLALFRFLCASLNLQNQTIQELSSATDEIPLNQNFTIGRERCIKQIRLFAPNMQKMSDQLFQSLENQEKRLWKKKPKSSNNFCAIP